MLQSLSNGIAFGKRLKESFRAMESENLARAGLGVALVGKAGNDSGAFIEEWQWNLVVDSLEPRSGVSFCLSLMNRQTMPFLFPLGLDHPNSPFIDEQHIISRADISHIFANCLSDTVIQVDLLK